MKKIDWARKLTSRKFWAAVAGFVTPIMAFMNVSDSTAVQVASIITAGGALIAYIIGEGMTDAASIKKQEGEE